MPKTNTSSNLPDFPLHTRWSAPSFLFISPSETFCPLESVIHDCKCFSGPYGLRCYNKVISTVEKHTAVLLPPGCKFGLRGLKIPGKGRTNCAPAAL